MINSPKPTYDDLEKRVATLEKTETALKKSEGCLRSLIRTLPDLIWLKDRQGKYLFCNSRFEHYFGAREADIIGKTDYDFVEPELADFFRHHDKLAMTSGGPNKNDEEVIFANDGHHEILETIKTPMYAGDGQLIGVLGIGRDITDRKRADEALRESEDKYRRIFDNSVVGIFQSTLEGRFINVNPRFAAMLGYASPDELIADITDIKSQYYVDPDDRARFLQELHQNGTVEDFEQQVRCKDGSKKWISNSARTVFDADGSFVYYEGVVSDISHRKQAEAERQMMYESLQLINGADNWEALLYAIIDRLKDWSGCDAVAIRLKEGADFPYFTTRGFPEEFVRLESHLCTYDKQGRLERDSTGSPVLECMCGNILCGRFDPSKNFFTTDGSFWSNCTTQLLSTTSDKERLTRTRNRCNSVGYESVALIPLRSGSETFGLIQFNDKKRGRFTPALITMYRHIADRIANFLAKKQADGRIVHLNNVLRGIRNVNKLITSEKDPHRLIQKACDLLVEARGFNAVLVGLTEAPDGSIRMHARAGRQLEYTQAMLGRGEIPACVRRAMTRHEIIDDRLYRRFCKRCPAEGTLNSDQEILVTGLYADNRSYGFMMTSLSRGMADSPEERDLLWEVAGDIAFALRSLQVEKERDKSEEALAVTQEQFRQAQKMEAVGRLAGGVAHDYNNMLSVIIGYAELALDKVPQEDPLHDDLKEILASGKRSTEITRQLLAFARKQTIAPQVLDLNETVESMLKMLRRLIGEDINLSWNPREGLWPVNIDPTQIDQIMANLCVNARDAIADVGRITIETGKVVIDEDYCTDHAGFVPGEFVTLSISDDGCGMDNNTLDKIFEPFFTTKAIGQGTGLGLATVYGIVKQNDGFINAYSEPDSGTTFRIYLPRYAGQALGDRCVSKATIPNGRGEVLLVVEDDASILKLADRLLTGFHYRVLQANTPAEALKLAETYSGYISLLITDVVMPGMNGRELYEQLTIRHPDLKCLYMSGYTADVIAHRGILEEGVNFIQKPFDRKDLARKVRLAIEENESCPAA
jgi:PAS domain S-box-containing protein